MIKDVEITVSRDDDVYTLKIILHVNRKEKKDVFFSIKTGPDGIDKMGDVIKEALPMMYKKAESKYGVKFDK